MQCTAALKERLSIDSKLCRIFGFLARHKLPSESTFSRAFAQFTIDDIADKVHATMAATRTYWTNIGTISRNSIAIVMR